MYESFKANPDIQKTIGSEQFPYAEKIQKLRIRYELDIKEISEILNVSVMQYLNYEYCNLNIPVEEYREKLELLKEKLKDKT